MENVVDAGTIQMPPKWALGYHQCRWSYEPAARVAEVSPILAFLQMNFAHVKWLVFANLSKSVSFSFFSFSSVLVAG